MPILKRLVATGKTSIDINEYNEYVAKWEWAQQEYKKQ